MPAASTSTSNRPGPTGGASAAVSSTSCSGPPNSLTMTRRTFSALRMLRSPAGSGSILVALSGHDLDGGGAGAGADHRLEVRAAAVLRPVGVVDAVVDRPF